MTDPSKSIRISAESHEAISAYGNVQATINGLANFLPVYDFCLKNGLTVEDAVNRLTVTPVDTSNRYSPNREKVNQWLEKLIHHNENCNEDEKVYLTQRLFLNLIGGNVNTISNEVRIHAKRIDEHNAKYGLTESSNRKLSHKIRESHGNIADWIKAKLV